jgi:hypothetical protein
VYVAGKGSRVDFNTGTSGTGRSGGSSGRSGGSPPGMSAAAGGDFDYRDPVQSFVGAARTLATQPAGFFRSIARRGDFINPLVFSLICLLISAFLGSIISIPLSLVSSTQNGASGVAGALIGGIVGLFMGLILMAILTPIFLFIWAGILHLLVMLLVKPSNAGFEATFRSAAYASMPALVSWIPIIGWLIAIVWSTVLSILGIRELHSTTTGRAALVVLIPLAIFFLIMFVLALAVGAFIFSMLNNQ